MATERAEGFWWVRWASMGDTDEVAEVVNWPEHARRLGISHIALPDPPLMVRTRRGWTAADANGLEWGPYLGKEPQPVDVDAYLAAHAAEVARAFDAYVPRFGVNGERATEPTKVTVIDPIDVLLREREALRAKVAAVQAILDSGWNDNDRVDAIREALR